MYIELFSSQIALANQLEFVRRDEDDKDLTPVERGNVDFRPTTREYQVLDMSRALPAGRYYWSLPREFLGERVSIFFVFLNYLFVRKH